MTPSEFIDLCFSLLAQFNAFTAEQYFDRDPEHVTYCKLSLTLKSPGVVELVMSGAWDDARVMSYSATGAIDWQSKVAHLLLYNPVP